MRNAGRAVAVLGLVAVWQLFTGCANQAADNRASGGGTTGGSTTGGSTGQGGNVAGSGAADFEAFRSALDQKQLPSPDSIDPAGFSRSTTPSCRHLHVTGRCACTRCSRSRTTSSTTGAGRCSRWR